MNKIGRIYKAFTEQPPEEQEWYQSRKGICDGCEYNTNNSKEEGDNSFKSAIAEALNKISPLKESGEGNCKLCTCFTYKKCSQKGEECPAGKWKSLEAFDKNIKVEAGDGVSEIYLDIENQYILRVPDMKQSEVHNFSLKITPKSKQKRLKRVATGCGCLMADVINNEDGTITCNMTLSTATKSIADNQKVNFYMYFSNKNQADSTSMVTVKFNVKAK